MSQITGGVVTYERLVKTGDYENKKLSVTLTFTIDEGQPNSNLDEVARSRAVVLVEQGLQTRVTPGGLVIPTPSGNIAEQAKPETNLPAAQDVRTAPPKKTKAKAPPLTNDVVTEPKTDWPEGQVNGGETRTVKQQLEASIEATEPAVAPKVPMRKDKDGNLVPRTLWDDGQPIEYGKDGRPLPPKRLVDTGEKTDPAKMVFPGDSRAAGNADLITGAVPASGIDRSTPAEPDWGVVHNAPEITNDHLVKTATAAVGRGIGQPAIRKLFEPLLPPGSEIKLSLIPQEHRASFLEEVAKLVPIGK